MKFPHDSCSIITTVFKVHMSTIFAYMYSENGVHKFITIGGTPYVSGDGEYRRGLIPFEDMPEPEITEMPEFQVEFYYPPSFTATEAFEEEINAGRYAIKLFVAAATATTSAFGQKIIPLGESLRELYIAKRTSDAFDCFPPLMGWFYIYNSNPGLYDTATMHIKYEQSVIANKIKQIVGGPLNDVDLHVRLTDRSLLMIMKHVGEPFKTAKCELSSVMELFCDYLYGLYCLHKKLKVIHGDIHGGNILVATDPLRGFIIDFSRSISLTDHFKEQGRWISNYIKRAKLEQPAMFLPEVIAPLDVYFLCDVIKNKFQDETPSLINEIGAAAYENVKQNLAAAAPMVPFDIFDFAEKKMNKELKNYYRFFQMKTGGVENIKNELETIKNILGAEETPPFYEYGDIKQTLPYNVNTKIIKTNTHIGQRKLLLNEIQFYTRHCAENSLVIYVGSASGEHTPVILNMFPTIKLILIDPAIHYMRADYEYIYSNPDALSDETKNTYASLEGPRGDRRIKTYIAQFKNTKFIGSDTRYNILRERPPPQNITSDTIDYIMRGPTRVFIIQDYATVGLLTDIKKAIGGRHSYVFVSDIRTTMFGPPTDFDIIWNNMQQMNFAQVMDTYSMLKFHPPYEYNDDMKKYIRDIHCGSTKNLKAEALLKYTTFKNVAAEFLHKKYKYIIDDIVANLKVPQKIISESSPTDYYYFGGKIYLQPWGPVGTSETRLILTPADLKAPLVKYNMKEWENKFYYFRMYRMVSFCPKFIAAFKGAASPYNGCVDCSIEIRILAEYKTGGKPIKDFSAIAGDVLQLQRQIDKFVDPIDSMRCPFHKIFSERPREFYLYQGARDDIYCYKITKDAVTLVKIYTTHGYCVFDDQVIPYINNKTVDSSCLCTILKKIEIKK